AGPGPGKPRTDAHAQSPSVPASAAAASNCWATPTEPQPSAMCETGTSCRRAIASVSASARLSGYQLISAAASAMALATEGSGPNGHSFEAGLNDWPTALATLRPGRYGLNWSRTERNRGDRSDTVVLRLSGRLRH